MESLGGYCLTRHSRSIQRDHLDILPRKSVNLVTLKFCFFFPNWPNSFLEHLKEILGSFLKDKVLMKRALFCNLHGARQIAQGTTR